MVSVSPIIIDVAGLQLNAADGMRLSHPLVGGVVLFARNWEDRKQLLSLCNAIKAIRADLLILVDHEGGRVQRFKTDGFTHLPAMRALGHMWMNAIPGNPSASAKWYCARLGFQLGSRHNPVYQPRLLGPHRIPRRPQHQQLECIVVAKPMRPDHTRSRLLDDAEIDERRPERRGRRRQDQVAMQ